MSFFDNIPTAHPVEIYYLRETFTQDPFNKKVLLTLGNYRTDEGEPYVLPVVKHAERVYHKDESLNLEYLTPLGMESFTNAAVTLLLGNTSPAIIKNKYIGVQSYGSTGALRIGAEYLVRHTAKDTFYTSNPGYENHDRIFACAGFKTWRCYRYLDTKTIKLDFKGMLEDLRNAEDNSVIVLQVCGHNPTGIDPTESQWDEVAQLFVSKRIFPFFDCTYQGLASGDVNTDAYVVRKFAELNVEFFCAQSFSKIFGMYNERIGNLTITVKDPELIPAINSQFAFDIRAMYSSPTGRSARIIAHICNNAPLYQQWLGNLKDMALRIKKARMQLKEMLDNMETPGVWEHLVDQVGMFSYTGLTPEQVEYMARKHHVYALTSSRICMAAICSNNLYQVAMAINDCVRKFPKIN
ncbi:unnamed protein product [Phyllotreta striolata]|uniref:Aspartate aminotransferase n=1 Tax=Phyllotreta striolata TaxID=444603 RepID=A0A9N9TGW7_PHYSR|nr:unnamed protein product [Phyllotreta striolata]